MRPPKLRQLERVSLCLASPRLAPTLPANGGAHAVILREPVSLATVPTLTPPAAVDGGGNAGDGTGDAGGTKKHKHKHRDKGDGGDTADGGGDDGEKKHHKHHHR